MEKSLNETQTYEAKFKAARRVLANIADPPMPVQGATAYFIEFTFPSDFPGVSTQIHDRDLGQIHAAVVRVAV